MPYNRKNAEKISEYAPFVGVVTEAKVIARPKKIIVRDDVQADLILLGGGIVCVVGSVWVAYDLWIKVLGGPVELPTWMWGILSGLMFLIGLLMVYTTLWYPRVVLAVLRGRLSIHQWRFTPVPYLSFERDEIKGFEFMPEDVLDGEPGLQEHPEEGEAPVEADGQGEAFVLYMITHDELKVPLCRMEKLQEMKVLCEKLSTVTGKESKMLLHQNGLQ